jgi:hypothetical protein
MQGPDDIHSCQPKNQELPQNEQDDPGSQRAATVDVIGRAFIPT